MARSELKIYRQFEQACVQLEVLHQELCEFVDAKRMGQLSGCLFGVSVWDGSHGFHRLKSFERSPPTLHRLPKHC